MSDKITPLHVKPIVVNEGCGPERCHICEGSRWIANGGGLDISKPGATLDLKLCYSCANSLQAIINAQLAYLEHKQTTRTVYEYPTV